MIRTRADFMLEYRRALDEVPVSLTKLLSISEHAVVDLRDVPVSNSKMDCSLAVCCDDVRVLNICEKSLDAATIRDLSIVGRDRLRAVMQNLGEIGSIRLHDAMSAELDDHLLSRDLDDEELQRVLLHDVVLRSDLRNKTARWLRWTFGDLGEHLVSLRGMSGVAVNDPDGEEEPLSPKIQKHLDCLNKKTPTKELHDDDL